MKIFLILSISFIYTATTVVANGVPRSCEDVLKHYGGTAFKEGVFTIDPDGAGGVEPSQVICTTRADLPGHGVTLVAHQLGITPVQQRIKGPGALTRYASFDYKLSSAQLDSLTKISGKCRQFVRLNAFHANNFYSVPWWVSRQGWNMTNWGGAPTNSSKCACAMEDRCDKLGYSCNSAMNDYQWRTDEGYLDDKRYLPVKQVPVRDLDHTFEDAYLMVKPMECYGDMIGGQPTEKCQCSLHSELKGSTKHGPSLLPLPDLVYGQGQNDVWLDDGIKTQKVTDVYPHFFNTKKRRQIAPSPNIKSGTSPECANVLQRCPVDCERLAKLEFTSTTLSNKMSVGSAKKPIGQVMCENAGVAIPPPGSRLVAFFKTSPTCGPSHSSTHIFQNATICCNVFKLPFTHQSYHVFNEKCNPNMNINSILTGR